MRNNLSILFVVFFLFFIESKAQVSSFDRTNGRFSFVKNVGQIKDQLGNHNSKVLYLLNTPGINVQLRENGFSYDVYERKKGHLFNSHEAFHFKSKKENYKNNSIKEELLFHRIDVDFLEVSENLKIKEFEISNSFINYYNISGFPNGLTNVKSFKKIVYENIYDSIDLEFVVPFDVKKPVEYNFIIKPHGNISDIKMKILGADVVFCENFLEMNLVHGKMKEIIPKSWLEQNGIVKDISVEYTEKGNNILGFTCTKKEINGTLVIDPTPVRQWATYFGGEQRENQYDGEVETDSNGNVLISGYTTSTNNIATVGSYQSIYNGLDGYSGYLAKFSSQGNLIWATYYAKNDTFLRGITVDSENNIIAVGETYDRVNISTAGTHQRNLVGDFDGFAVKFNADGQRIWGTYYGGESFDYCTGISVDDNDNLFISGHTSSNSNIASNGAFRQNVSLNVHNNWDAFLAKLDKNGRRVWATYYGGTHGFSVDVDSKGNAYLFGTVQRGEASSENISTPGAYQEGYSDEGSLSWNDAFLVKFSSNGERLWGTFFGGDSYDDPGGVVVDNMDNVIICGSTRSNVFPTTSNAHQSDKGGSFYDYDAFLAKFDSNGQIQWNTFYGGAGGDGGFNLDVDDEDNILMVGATSSLHNIATTDSYQEGNLGNNDAYIVKFNSSGVRLWGTYYGGENSDSGLDIEYANNGDLYLLGFTFGSTNLATPGAHQESFNDNIDNFLVKFKDCQSSISINVTEFVCEGESIEFTATGGAAYTWSGPNNFSSSDQNPVIFNANATHSGTYSVFVESGDGCDDIRTFEVLVSKRPIANPIDNLQVCEDTYATGISISFDTSSVESQVLGGQLNMTVSYFDEKGNQLPSPLPNPLANTTAYNQTITVRVANQDNLVCYSETSFKLIVNSIPNLETIDDLVICDNDYNGFAFFDLQEVKDGLIGGNSGIDTVFFYENGQQIQEPLNAVENLVANEEIITVRATNTSTGCNNETTFKLKVNPLPIANPLTELVGCDDNNDGISEYFDTSNVEAEVLGNQTGMEVSFYNSSGDMLSGPLPNPFTNSKPNQEIITVRVTNPVTTCYAETSLVLNTAAQPRIGKPDSIYACDEGDGFGSFDTSLIESQLIGNQNGLSIFYFDANGNSLPSPLPINFKNSQSWIQTIYVRVENALNNLCYSETNFDLIVNELPFVNIDEKYFLCNLEPSMHLGFPEDFDTYNLEYQDGTVISNTAEAYLIEAGNYTLTIGEAKNGIQCENSFNFELIRSVLPKITNVEYKELSDDNFIKIIASGDGDFEYSINGLDYKSDNLFENLVGGIYTAYVRDKHGCGKDSRKIIIIDYPKYFTPNGDGINDFWQIRGATEFPNAQIRIYDRYGKLLKQIFANNPGWDGTFNGKKMTVSDYWFTVTLDENYMFSGHFALKI